MFRAGLLLLTVVGVGGMVVACSETTSLGTASTARPGPRAGADDADLWNLIPVDADAIADVDLGALRASPWSQTMMTGGFAGDREDRLARFGYDVFADADRMVVVGGESVGATRTLTLARGRFDPERIGGAFAGVTRGAWRDSPLWQAGPRAVALVTPRTVAQGGPGDVRAAVDAGWGIVPDARGGALGELRRQLQADRRGPAVFIAAAITDAVRARANGIIELPPGLERGAARLDLGEDLDAEAVVLMADAHSAEQTAALWTSLVSAYARERMVAILGLSPVLKGTQIAAEGKRIHARLHIPAERRGELAEKLLALLQMVAAARPEQ
jgi:hypothetical protein